MYIKFKLFKCSLTMTFFQRIFVLIFFVFCLFHQFCRGNKTISNNDSKKDIIPYDFQIVANAIAKLNYSDCVQDILTVLDSIKNHEKWALKMFDASAKFPIGILFGNFYQLGNFDECVSIQKDNYNISGKYCLADIELLPSSKQDSELRYTRSSSQTFQLKSRNSFNNTIHWSICVPSQCKSSDISTIVQEIFVAVTEHTEIAVNVMENNCHIEHYRPFSKLEIIFGGLLGIFCMFIVMSTVFHYYCIIQGKKTFAYSIESAQEQTDKNSIKSIIQCFSIISTVKKFLHVRENSANANLECICGIRFISMCVIIAGHSLLFMIAGPVQNTIFFEEEKTKLENAIFLNSPLLVDTFLLLSGFLMCYMLLQELEKRKGRINFLILYIARYVRLTPSYLFMIGLYSSILYRIGSGPLWDSRIGIEQERCLQSWWTNLLYINNYVNTDQLCMFQSWYLAVDFHLFIIAPFLIYPLWKWQTMGKLVLTVCTILSVLVPFGVTYSQKLDPTLLTFASEVYDLNENFYFKNAYIKTHMRASSYFIGLFFGYLVYKLQINGTKIPKWTICCGWIVSAFFGIIAMYSVVVFFESTHQYNALEAAAYAALHRVAWCISIGWILVVCITDNAVYVNKFLSWNFFIPLSRLTYCAYLINGLVEILNLGIIRSGTYLSKYELTNKTLSHIVITFLGAFLLCVMFESPIHGLEKILLKREKRHQSKSNNAEDNTNSSNL